VRLLHGHSVMETLSGLHVVSGLHVEAPPLQLGGGVSRVPHHQLVNKQINDSDDVIDTHVDHIFKTLV